MKRMYGRALSMLLVLLLSLSLVTPAFAAGKTWSFEQTGEIATQPETSEPQWGRDPSKPSGTLRDAVETWCTNAPEGQKSKFYSLDLGNKSQCSVGEVYKSGDKWKCDVTVYYQPFLDKCNRDYTNKDHILAVGESESKTLTLTWNDSFDFQPDHWDYGYVQFKVTHGPHTPAAPTINDLSKITVKVSCTNTVMGHASKSYNLANASEYTLGEVMKSGNDYICNVTVNGSVFVGYYGDSHTLTGDATKTVRMKYDSTAKAWKVDGTLPVEFTVVCETPVAPQPVATDLIKNVVVDCTNDVMNHADATYALLDGSYTVNVTGTYPTVTGTITVSADKYVAEYNKTNAGHTLSSDSPVVVNLTYDFTTGIWTANTDTVKFEVVCETPVAPQPVATDLIKNVVVDCTNDVMNHADATYGLLDGSYTVNVTGTYPTVTGTITVSADKYVAEYNKTNAGHTLSSDSPVVVNLTYDFTTGIWTANTDTVKFEVVCTTPVAPQPVATDLIKNVVVDCTNDVMNHADATYGLLDGSYTVNVTGTYPTVTGTITVNADKYVAEYNKTNAGHTLSSASPVVVNLTYSFTTGIWTANTDTVKFEVACTTPGNPEIPTLPKLKELLGQVKVDCINTEMTAHTERSFELIANSYAATVNGTYPNVTCNVTVNAAAYVNAYNAIFDGHSVTGATSKSVTLRYDFDTETWTVADAATVLPVSFTVVCETPGNPEIPTLPKLKELLGQVKVDCINTEMTAHTERSFELIANSYAATVNGTYPNVTCNVTVNAAAYVNAYNAIFDGHSVTGATSKSVTLRYDFDTETWSVADAATVLPVSFTVVCTTPHAPEMPTEDELKAMIQVKVDCISTNSHKNDPYTFALMSDTYGLSPITGNARDGYTTTITIFAKGVTGEGGYVKEYNRLVSKGHVLSGDSQVKLTLANDGNGWYVKPYSREITTVTFYVKHGYTVTYKWKGDYPYGAVPPVDSNVYEYGDLATVAAAPKDMKWNSKDGGWKWDSVRERWYWVDNGAYWYGDKINGVEGYWAFTGWEREVWVEATRWERGHYKTEYLRPGSKIEITEDTVIYGTWEFRPVGGTIVLNKTVKAPAGFKGDDTYTFEIYDSKDAKKPVKTVKVEAGKNVYVSLPNGTYYIYEVNAAVKGYDLDVTVKGDISAEGEKIVLRNDAVYVNFVNTYTDEYTGPKLNDNDHFAYIVGYPDGTARPEGNITREEVATIFFRLLTDESRAKFLSDYNTFSDVSSNRWSNTAISTLVNAGILKGYPDGTFRPAGYITRAEMATIIAKFANLSGARDNFTDITNHWANAYIRSAASNGWVSGYPDGRFCPDQFITRAETMAMINRVLTRNPDSPSDLLPNMVTFTDNLNTNAWYYLHVQEAANGHTYDREKNGTEYWVALTR